MLDVSITERCPHCKRWSHLQLVFKHSFDEELGTAWDHDEVTSHNLKAYFAFVCRSCENLLLYFWDEPLTHRLVELEEIFIEDVRDELLQEDNELFLPYTVWPSSNDRSLSDSVPPLVKNLYRVALNVKIADPNLFAVQIRKVLEAICYHQGAKRQTLWRMLEELSSRGILPQTLAEIAREMKDTGNKGAHVDAIEVRREDAETIDDFLHMIINYVYDAPAKLDAFRKLAPNLIQPSDDTTIH